jgi:hypothetical protein
MTEGPVARDTDQDTDPGDGADGEQVVGDRGANPDDTRAMSDEGSWAEAAWPGRFQVRYHDGGASLSGPRHRHRPRGSDVTA